MKCKYTFDIGLGRTASVIIEGKNLCVNDKEREEEAKIFVSRRYRVFKTLAVEMLEPFHKDVWRKVSIDTHYWGSFDSIREEQ